MRKVYLIHCTETKGSNYTNFVSKVFSNKKAAMSYIRFRKECAIREGGKIQNDILDCEFDAWYEEELTLRGFYIQRTDNLSTWEYE